jgi:uncharacterized pyridoxamine 5'-phosphate oxidase family protein
VKVRTGLQLARTQSIIDQNRSVNQIDLYAFLVNCKLGVLGTVGPDGDPQSSLVGIAVTARLEIIFDTVRTSRKYANLTRRPVCSFAIGWTGEQTIQYEGVAEELRGSELDRCQAIYFEAWPECRTHLSWPDIVYFVVRPRWVRYSDFAQCPPLIKEFRL